MTLFAVSILITLGLAAYGLRVLVSRWEQPRRPSVLLSVQPLAPVPAPQPAPPATPPVWIRPAFGAPAPMAPLMGVATPPPMKVPEAAAAPPPAPPSAARPPHPRPTTRALTPSPAWTPPVPPSRMPSQGAAGAGINSRGLPHRLARGSIPPDFTADAEPDTDPAVPALVEPEPLVTRGSRYSVIRSSRR
jgi:hypothetical protein